MPSESLLVSSLPVNLAALAALVAVSIVDARTRRAPQVVTLPMLAALGLWRLWRGDAVVFLCWMGAISLWLFHLCGAGDVKVIMIELALWPSLTFVVALGVTVALLGSVVSLVRCRGFAPLLRSLQVAGTRLLSGRLPSESELQLYGSPQVFLYVAGAAVYQALFYSTRCVAWGGLGG
jgi:hypothetical protein